MTAPLRLSRRGRCVRLVAITVGSGAFFTAGLMLPTASTAMPGNCPAGTHLTTYEDGSGACYPDQPMRGERDQYPATGTDGRELTWPENTFPWDCHTMGNRLCGPQ